MMRARYASRQFRGALLLAATLSVPWLPPSRAAAETAPAPAPPSPAAPHDVTLDGLTFQGRRRTLSIPRVEARGTSLSAGELRDILDPSSPLTPGQRAAKLSAASIVMPTVTVSTPAASGDAEGATFTAHDVRLTDVVAGKAASLAVRAIEGHFQADPGQRGEVSTGAVAAHGVDAALAAAIATGKRDDPALPLSTIVADLSAADARLAVEGVEVSLDGLEIGPIEGRPPLRPFADLAPTLGGAGGDRSSQAPDGFLSALVDVATSYKLNRLALRGLSVRGGGAPAFTSALRSLTVENLNLSGLGSAEFVGFAYGSPELDIALDRLKLADIGRGSLYGQILAAASGLFSPDEHRPAPDGTSAIDLAGLTVALRSTGQDAPFPPGTVNTIQVPTLEIRQGVADGGTRVSSDTRLIVRYDLPAAGTGRDLQDLRAAGLSSLDLTLGYRLAYDANTKALDLDALSLDGKGLGAMSLSARLGAVGPLTPSPKMTADELTERLADATFQSFAATVTDRGIIGTALPVLARRAGSTAGAFKADLKARIREGVRDLLGATPAAERVDAAAASLLDGPGTLSLSVKAPPGLTFREIGASDPAAVAGHLDIQARTRH